MPTPTFGRRGFLRGSAAVAVAASAAGSSRRAVASDSTDAFQFEVVRSDADWRSRLTEAEYKILRQNDTELPHTSPLVKEDRSGSYCCKGCDLTLYESVWKVPLKIGWVFFSHSVPQTVLTAIDGDPPYGMGGESEIPALIEVHCRRCGSHLGHLVFAQSKLVHCINGTALDFRASA